MDLIQVIKDFFELVKTDNIEIYNEASLQYELAIYLRDKFDTGYKVQLERNISHFGFEKESFEKKEIDIVIYRDDKKYSDILVIELKGVINQKIARPVTVFDWLIDIRFLEQLKIAGIKKCISIFLTDNQNFKKGNLDVSKHLSDLRNGRVKGEYQKHRKTSRSNVKITLSNEYQLNWQSLINDQIYVIVDVK